MTGSAHAIGGTGTPLLEMTIGSAFDRTVAAHVDREALVVPFQGVRLTYGELAERVDRLAMGMLGLGLETGDRLGMWSPNNAEWVYVQFAAAKVGVILVNINPAYQTEELRFALAQSGCRALVSATGFKSSDYVAMVAAVRPSLPLLEHVVFLDTPDWDGLLEAGDGVGSEELAARGASLDNHDPINIQYTSGTTGFPKGATLSHRNMLNNGYFLGEGFRYSETDRVCIPVPFYHCFGMVIGNLANLTHGDDHGAAGTVVRCPRHAAGPRGRTLHQRSRCADHVHRHARPPAVPRVRPLVVADRDDGRVSLPDRGDEAVRRRDAHERGHHRLRHDRDIAGFHTDVARRPPRQARRHGRTGATARRGEDRRPCHGGDSRANEAGELCTKGYSVMLGYWNEPQMTAEAIDADGWMHTGDLAMMDADGYVSIVGRIKDMIIRGGENIYPREVEEFLYGHPDIVDVQVVGVPDEKHGLRRWCMGPAATVRHA